MTRNIYSTSGRGAVEFIPYPQEFVARQRATAPLFYDCVWLDGELVPAEDAQVGKEAGIFEEIRCYPTERGPAVFRLEAHLQRFLQAAQAVGVGELRYNLLDLRRAVHVTVHVNNRSACTVRPIVYVERQPDGDLFPSVAVVTAGFDPAEASSSQDVALRLMSFELDQEGPDGEMTREALRSRTARATRARTAARRHGFDEAILLGRDGVVIDCTGENLFMVRNSAVFTSRATNGEDVARDTACILLQDLGYSIAEQPLTRDFLYLADELFLCGTASEITPVSQIDDHVLRKPAPGPVTRKLQHLYADTAHGVGRRSRGWLEYVMMEPLF